MKIDKKPMMSPKLKRLRISVSCFILGKVKSFENFCPTKITVETNAKFPITHKEYELKKCV
jgi:hypothetical protein